jgi:hypothetical protein
VAIWPDLLLIIAKQVDLDCQYLTLQSAMEQLAKWLRTTIKNSCFYFLECADQSPAPHQEKPTLAILTNFAVD